LPERVGLQPYITIEVYERLVVASANTGARCRSSQPDFAEANAIFYAGWLGTMSETVQSHAHTFITWMGWANPKRYTTATRALEDEGIFVAANFKQLQFADLVPVSRDC